MNHLEEAFSEDRPYVFSNQHNPDADHIGGSLGVFDAFEVGVIYVSGDPKGTLCLL